jgi:hypothetical protein
LRPRILISSAAIGLSPARPAAIRRGDGAPRGRVGVAYTPSWYEHVTSRASTVPVIGFRGRTS